MPKAFRILFTLITKSFLSFKLLNLSIKSLSISLLKIGSRIDFRILKKSVLATEHFVSSLCGWICSAGIKIILKFFKPL
jgi:hypothetical protein